MRVADRTEIANRTAKAMRLVELLDDIAARPQWEYGPITGPGAVAYIDTPDVRNALGVLAGGRPISDETWQMTLTMIERRRPTPTDPFEGL